MGKSASDTGQVPTPLFYLAWKGFSYLLEIAVALPLLQNNKTQPASLVCAESRGWVSQVLVRKLNLKWNAATHASHNSTTEGLNCSQTRLKAFRGIRKKKKKTTEISQRTHWKSATSKIKKIFNFKKKKKGNKKMFATFWNADLEQNISFASIESKHI